MSASLRALQMEKQKKVWDARDAEWPKWNKNRNVYNKSDCSGFVISVANSLGAPILSSDKGSANALHTYFKEGNAKRDGWSIIGEGSDAALIAALSTEEGRFVVAAWKNVAGRHGHVAVVAGYMGTALKSYKKTESRIVAYWGQYGGEGEVFAVDVASGTGKATYSGRLSASFGAPKHPFILYASYPV